jgi:pimeloyl-ACP methyl ester carboxylesterase
MGFLPPSSDHARATAPMSGSSSRHPRLHHNTLDKGGHFAAWEQPELFAAKLRAAFTSLR